MVSQALLAGGGTVLAGAVVRGVPQRGGSLRGPLRGVSLNADFSLDLDATLAAIQREQPKLIWWCIQTTRRATATATNRLRLSRALHRVS